jgi:hypothetical protein
MEKLVKNKAYEYEGSILVFTGKTEKDEAEFLEHYSDKDVEVMIQRTIPLERITLERSIMKIEDGDKSIGAFYYYNKDWLCGSKEDFQEKLKQYDNAII